jgi:predicted phosphohydrolase
MNIVAVSDLHYPRHKNHLEKVAKKICESGADVLILGGDISEIRDEYYHHCLALFDRFKGIKVATVGNHDLWVPEGYDSYQRYREWFPELFKQYGFHYLDGQARPFVYKNVAFVGNVGWYDYSFRQIELPSSHNVLVGYADKAKKKRIYKPWSKLNEEDYARKVLLYTSIKDKKLLVVTWNDVAGISWTYSDSTFCNLMLEHLETQLNWCQQSSHIEKIVSVTHHIPFKEGVKERVDPGLAYSNAYMGNHRMGKLLLDYPKVKIALWGHSHSWMDRNFQISHIQGINMSFSPILEEFVQLEI